MAISKNVTVTSVTTNNNTQSTVSKVVEAVVVNNALVADKKSTNPGVVHQGMGYTF